MCAVESAHFDSDGTRVVTDSTDGTAKVFDSSGDLIVTLEGHTGSVESADFSPDGSLVVTAGGGDSTAKVWRPDAALIETIDTRFPVVFGTGTVDVTQINIATLRLCLTDLSMCTTVGTAVSKTPLDRGQPSDIGAGDADCIEDIANTDGMLDLDVGFIAQEVKMVIGCGTLSKTI